MTENNNIILTQCIKYSTLTNIKSFSLNDLKFCLSQLLLTDTQNCRWMERLYINYSWIFDGYKDFYTMDDEDYIINFNKFHTINGENFILLLINFLNNCNTIEEDYSNKACFFTSINSLIEALLDLYIQQYDLDEEDEIEIVSKNNQSKLYITSIIEKNIKNPSNQILSLRRPKTVITAILTNSNYKEILDSNYKEILNSEKILLFKIEVDHYNLNIQIINKNYIKNIIERIKFLHQNASKYLQTIISKYLFYLHQGIKFVNKDDYIDLIELNIIKSEYNVEDIKKIDSSLFSKLFMGNTLLSYLLGFDIKKGNLPFQTIINCLNDLKTVGPELYCQRIIQNILLPFETNEFTNDEDFSCNKKEEYLSFDVIEFYENNRKYFITRNEFEDIINNNLNRYTQNPINPITLIEIESRNLIAKKLNLPKADTHISLLKNYILN
jgi:hypothetical protein